MDSSFCKSKKKQKLLIGFLFEFYPRFCESQNLVLDCHANPLDLLAMTDLFCARFCDSQNLNRSNGGSALDYFYLKPAQIELKVHRAVF